MKIRKDDEVLVIAGRERGKAGKVRQAFPRENRVVVEGINMVKRHMKPRGMARQAGIISREAPLHASKVMLLCPKCRKPTRVGIRLSEDGDRIRFCKRCQEVIK
jgi:large subunit ribosomal protein L24